MTPIEEKERERILDLLKGMGMELEGRLEKINTVRGFVCGIKNKELKESKL